MITVMTRPKVLNIEQTEKKFCSCDNCVTKKMCVNETKCLFGSKLKRKKNG